MSWDACAIIAPTCAGQQSCKDHVTALLAGMATFTSQASEASANEPCRGPLKSLGGVQPAEEEWVGGKFWDVIWGSLGAKMATHHAALC